MTPQTLTVVMYHYVRPLARTRYPAIKGLDLQCFRGQLAYIRRHYHPITAADLVAAVRQRDGTGVWELPPSSILLTFDDGYADHFDHVFPLLDDAGVQGSFFAPGRAVGEGLVLDVNKIHFVLASVDDKALKSVPIPAGPVVRRRRGARLSSSPAPSPTKRRTS